MMCIKLDRNTLYKQINCNTYVLYLCYMRFVIGLHNVVHFRQSHSLPTLKIWWRKVFSMVPNCSTGVLVTQFDHPTRTFSLWCHWEPPLGLLRYTFVHRTCSINHGLVIKREFASPVQYCQNEAGPKQSSSSTVRRVNSRKLQLLPNVPLRATQHNF